MPNDEVDTAIILEGEIRRRVREVATSVVREEVARQMGVLFAEQKAKMMMEISIAVGKMLRVVEEEGRNPLWETDINKLHNISKVEKDALREQTSSV